MARQRWVREYSEGWQVSCEPGTLDIETAIQNLEASLKASERPEA